MEEKSDTSRNLQDELNVAKIAKPNNILIPPSQKLAILDQKILYKAALANKRNICTETNQYFDPSPPKN